MGRIIDRIKKRRQAKQPVQQYYGGSEQEADMLRQRNYAAEADSATREKEALAGMANERQMAQRALQGVDRAVQTERQIADQDFRSQDATALAERAYGEQRLRDVEAGVASERDRAGQAYGSLDRAAQAERARGAQQIANVGQRADAERVRAALQYGQAQANVQDARRTNAAQAMQYGLGADESLRDYQAGRGDILRGAGDLEELGRGAQGRYQNASDMAFKAATERNQRQALSLAAGRGNDSIRTALATADAGNREAQLEQQVVRAQEMNQLLGLEQGAIQGAANIRSGVGAADQGAAGIQAGRQQVSTGAVNQLLGQEADITRSDVASGQFTSGLRRDLTGQEQALALGTGQLRAGLAEADTAAGNVASGLRRDIAGMSAQQAQATGALRAGLAQTNAQVGAQATGQRAGLATTDAQIGLGVQQAAQQAGAAREGRYLGAETQQNTAQLGANTAYEAARLGAADKSGLTQKLFSGMFDFGNLRGSTYGDIG